MTATVTNMVALPAKMTVVGARALTHRAMTMIDAVRAEAVAMSRPVTAMAGSPAKMTIVAAGARPRAMMTMIAAGARALLPRVMTMMIAAVGAGPARLPRGAAMTVAAGSGTAKATPRRPGWAGNGATTMIAAAGRGPRHGMTMTGAARAVAADATNLHGIAMAGSPATMMIAAVEAAAHGPRHGMTMRIGAARGLPPRAEGMMGEAGLVTERAMQKRPGWAGTAVMIVMTMIGVAGLGLRLHPRAATATTAMTGGRAAGSVTAKAMPKRHVVVGATGDAPVSRRHVSRRETGLKDR